MRTRIKLKHEIPEEIIEEILCNLPVKSLLRFKCVSKPWRSFITSEYFINKHHKKKSSCADKTGNDNITMLMFSFKHLITETELLNIRSCCLRDGQILQSNLDIQQPPAVKHVYRVSGSCNGLVLVSVKTGGRNNLMIWNPSTRETKYIEGDPFLCERDYMFVYGFGYDESNHDYKVVCIKIHKPYRTKMYSSKTDCWKEIGNFGKDFPQFRYGKFVTGRLHWLTVSNDSIVSLHLSEEKYDTVALPELSETSGCYYVPELESLGGYLCLVADLNSLGWNVWAMMEYGVGESWTKILKFPVQYGRVCRSLMPLYLMKNGDVIVRVGPDVVVYRGENELRRPRVGVPDAITQSIVCVETLVSPFGHNDDEETATML